MLTRPTPKRRREPTIALINIVFLMLIFFLIASTVAPPLDDRVDLVDTIDLEGRAPPDAAVILPDGAIVLRGASVTPAQIVAQEGPSVRLVPDRALPAQDFARITRELREAGAEEGWLVTERGLE